MKDHEGQGPRTAAEWLSRLRSGSDDAETDAELRAWLESDTAHEVEFERCELAVAVTEELWQDPERRDALAEGTSLAEDDGRAARWSRMSAWVTTPVGATAIAASIAAFVLLVVVPLVQSPAVIYETGTGEQRTLVLPDQSTITLNTATAVEVDVRADRRQVRILRGEAYFAVAEDPTRAFEVRANNGLISVTGTEFGVALRPSGQVMVSVLAGSVEVTPAAEQGLFSNQTTQITELHQGQAVTYWSGGAVSDPYAAPAKRINAWLEGKLDFDGMTLQQAIEEYNRYTTRQIVIASEDIKSLPVSGIVRIQDIDSFVFMLEGSLGLRSLNQAGTVVLMAPAEP